MGVLPGAAAWTRKPGSSSGGDERLGCPGGVELEYREGMSRGGECSEEAKGKVLTGEETGRMGCRLGRAQSLQGLVFLPRVCAVLRLRSGVSGWAAPAPRLGCV